MHQALFYKECLSVKQRKYFEILASVGRKCAPDADYPLNPEILLEDMKYARVHGAAVLENTAIDYSFVYGNNRTIELAKKNPRFVSVAAVPTTAALESLDDNYFNNILDAGARALVIHDNLRCAYNARTIKPIAEALMAHNRPLIVPCINEDKLERIDLIAEAYPALAIVLHGASWGFGRSVCELLARHENIYVDMSSLHLNNLLEMMREKFGIHRLLYSSAWPLKSMGAMKAFVEYADITEEEKDLVAYGNACRLLGISIDDFKLYDDAECELDSIAREADAGIPISVPVFDAHTHMVEEADKTVNNCMMMYSDCDSVVKKMDRLGIDSLVTAPWSGISFNGIKGNEEVVYSATKHPGRIYGFTTCNIHYAEDLNSWKSYHEKYPEVFVGIKPYPPYQKFEFADEVAREWFEYANEHHMPALIHVGPMVFTEKMEKLIASCPNVTFIIAHTGSDYITARNAIALAKKFDNVILEITYTSTARNMIEFLVEQVGAERVLYGSDLPMRDPTPQLAWVCYAKISEDDKKKILSENFKRILAKRI